jgi:glutathione S-transferase
MSDLKLMIFPASHGVPNLSPFCAKAEVLLKMSGQPYEVVAEMNPAKGPKGKFPVLTHGARDIPDSEFIRQYLEKTFGVDFDEGLSDADRATARAFARLLEERTYWTLVYSRWVDDTNWPAIRKHWFGGMPPVIRSLIPAMAQKQVKAALKGHGIGRHSAEEIYALGAQDMRDLAALLGDKPFMMGDKPTSLDATAFSFLINIMDTPFLSPMQDETQKHGNLRAYVDRCKALWYPEL